MRLGGSKHTLLIPQHLSVVHAFISSTLGIFLCTPYPVDPSSPVTLRMLVLANLPSSHPKLFVVLKAPLPTRLPFTPQLFNYWPPLGSLLYSLSSFLEPTRDSLYRVYRLLESTTFT
ncbi:uncharacterized protein EI90DRAFT_3116668 [Cantharellus anzutake]|uniref:uncharacterized protein n=1 Tax=Cantharellus anzutake TaxID=1750568 RepID=UPI0019086BF9|nr:uncharacterized protein EI90DRAFT_3116668 [Cantharellus anzutake]KAF8341556.1 hypothetical protein EI90DRAFT_3116668 [Cantharellus anzutake]